MRIRKILLFAGAALLVLVLLMIFSSKASAEEIKTPSVSDVGVAGDINIHDNNIVEKLKEAQLLDKPMDRVALKPDLTIKNVVFIESPKNGDVITVHVSVKNVGNIPAANVKTGFYIDSKEIETKNVMSIRRNDVAEVTFSWKAEAGEHLLMVYADPYDEIDEINENNNMYTATLSVVGEVGQNIVGGEPPPLVSKDAGAVLAAVGALSVLGLLGLLYSDKYRFFTLLAPLYTRIKKKHVLDHFTRGRIYGYIETNPGAHYNIIRDALSLNNGSLTYHLRMLEKTEYINSKKAGKCRYFYPASMNISEKNGLSNMQNSILEKIVEKPDITQKEIADETGVSQQVISYNVKKMMKNGVVRAKKNGGESCLYVAESFGA